MATFRKRGDKWFAEIRRKKVSRFGTFHTKAEAEVWARAVEVEIDTGKIASRETATLADAFDRYSKEVSPRNKGCRWEQIRLRKLKAYPVASVWFRNLAPEHLAQFRDQRAAEVKASSVNRELNLISSVLAVARDEWGWIETNPLSRVRRLRNPRHRDRRVTNDEIAAICEQLGYRGGPPANMQQETAVMFLLAIETGMRLGEMAGFQPEDVHLHRRFLVVRDSKNQDARHVPLSKEAARLLGLLNGGAFTVRSQGASAAFYKAKVAAKIKNLTFHDSRHEAMTRLAPKLSVLDLARMVGVRDPRTLMIYYNATATEIAARLD